MNPTEVYDCLRSPYNFQKCVKGDEMRTKRLLIALIFTAIVAGASPTVDIEKAISDAKSRSIDLRQTAADQLGRASDKEVDQVGQVLLELLKDQSATVRVHACRSLGKIKWIPAFNRLKAVSVNDEKPLVKQAAAAAMKQFGPGSTEQADQLDRDAAAKQFVSEHPVFTKIRKIISRPASSSAPTDRYENYRFRTQKIIEAVGCLESQDGIKTDDFAESLKAISEMNAVWSRSLDEREYAYHSADSLREGMRHLGKAAAAKSQSISRWADAQALSKDGQAGLAASETDAVIAAGKVCKAELDATYTAVEDARRFLLSREGQRQTVP